MARFNDQRKCAVAHARHSGFTLIELAVVIAIIAVIVGGVMTTSTLTRSAALQNVAREFSDLQQATNRYQELYGSLPGDTPNASMLFGCGGCDGNGNGKLDVDEEGLFLEHLSRAKLLKAELRAANQGGGKQLPLSDAGRGRVIAIEARVPDRIVAVLKDETGTRAALSPEEARRIDRHIDDGTASNGRMMGEGAACKSAGRDFNLQIKDRSCDLAYVLVGRAFSNALDKNTEYHWDVRPAGTVSSGTWVPDATWGECSQSCGGGIQTRNVTCVPNPSGPVNVPLTVACKNIITGVTVADTQCNPIPRPASTRRFSGCTDAPPAMQQTCNPGACPNGWLPLNWGACRRADGSVISTGVWESGPWGNCNAECGGGIERRKVFCRGVKGVKTRSVTCPSEATHDCDGPRPPDTEECIVDTCTGSPPEASRACNEHTCASGWRVTPWNDCSPAPRWNISAWGAQCVLAYTATVVQCGGPAVQVRSVTCTAGGVQTRGVNCPSGDCTGTKPEETKPCSYTCQGEPPTDIALCFAGNRWGDVYNSGTQVFRHTEDEAEGWVGCLSE
jgi:prepilin-type N-terminal cleavage/methylation domain-containing protein